ncbi:MAG: hypothetical protein BWY57_02154 [Betaproteobacteria bacterium ADurb.Bin341]|nr:MAG: hypothetical protein BWY57_02154 [Betaproteobacteria bacterium ADurb.Bin341]
MSNSLGLLIVFGVIGLLVLVAIYRFMIQRRQLSAGRELGCFQPVCRDGKLVFDQQLNISEGRRWCRLMLRLTAQTVYQINQTPRYFFKRVALVIGTPYLLTISDSLGQELYREENTLARFVAWLGGRGGETSTMVSERGQATLKGQVAFLEFLPSRAGVYRIVLEIQAKIEDQAPGSSSHWEVLEAELAASEGVEPLSRTVKYPHRRVEL